MPKVTQNADLINLCGERVRECRKKLNISQSDLVYEISRLPENNDKERNEKQISYIERGKRSLSPEYARLIGKVLGVRPEYLLGEDDFPTETMKKLYPSAKKCIDKWDQEKAVQRFFSVYNAWFQPVAKLAAGYENLSTDEFVKLPPEEQKKALKTYIETDFFNNPSYHFQTEKGEILFTCSSVEKAAFIQDISDYIEFKLNKMIERNGRD